MLTNTKLTQAQKIRFGKFLSDEISAEKKKPAKDRRPKDQIMAIGYSKIEKGEL